MPKSNCVFLYKIQLFLSLFWQWDSGAFFLFIRKVGTIVAPTAACTNFQKF